MTRLGIGSYALAWAVGVPGYPPPSTPLDAFGLVRFAAERGVRLVQIADNLPLGTLTAESRAALRREAERLGVAVEVGTRGSAPEHLREYLAIAEEFGSAILRVVVDSAQHHPAPNEIVTTIRDLLPELERSGIVLAIENHDRFQARTLVEMLEAVGSPQVGICLDTVNSFGALEGPAEVVAALAPYVVNLHVKDFSIRRAEHNMGFVLTGTPAGAGMLKLDWLFETLNRHGRDYNAILELWTPPQENTDATAALEQAWAEESIDTLRQYLKD